MTNCLRIQAIALAMPMAKLTYDPEMCWFSYSIVDSWV